MKLLLTSNGFTNEEIIQKAEELVGKPRGEINVALINEGYAVEHGDNSWTLDDLNSVKNNFGGSFEMVNLLALSKEKVVERIELADMIFVLGGHADYLMSVFNKTGFTESLKKLLETKVYVGVSAGSMVIANRMSTQAYARVFGEEGDYGTAHYMGIVNVAVKPHLNSEDFPNNRVAVLLEISQTYSGTICGLDDNSAIVIDGDPENYSLINSKIVKIVGGKLIEG